MKPKVHYHIQKEPDIGLYPEPVESATKIRNLRCFGAHNPNYVLTLPLHTWCGYEIVGMTLLCHAEGAMRFGRDKAMSRHVSVCVNYDFNVIMPVVWKLWR